MIHPTATVDEGAALGEGTKVWHYAHVSAGARIGRDCVLGQNVYVGPGVIIGDRVRIQNNVSVYAGVALEDDVFCGPSCVFTNVRNPRAAISRNGRFDETLVRRGATIGANATIVCGATIGRHAFIAAGAVVSAKSVPDYALMIGVPARRAGWVGRHGERLSASLVCPVSGLRYEEVDGERLRCVDLDEDAPLG
ncbi:MAG: acyltransferase [Labilithrix sp.]